MTPLHYDGGDNWFAQGAALKDHADSSCTDAVYQRHRVGADITGLMLVVAEERGRERTSC